MTTLRLWLIRETDMARLFSKTPPGRDAVPVWIPRSVVKRIIKFPVVPGQPRECEVEIEDWFVEKEGI